MNPRQKFLKAVYPIFLFWSKITGKSTVLSNDEKTHPMQSLYDLTIELNNGQQLKLDAARGKKLLLVNTASDCGYTPQYDDLQKLHEQYQDKLMIIGFPANDFGQQEKGSDKDIAEFCRVNFGVTFPLAKKSTVVKGKNQHPVFQWLTQKEKNGWNTEEPTWNFSKYLINEEGTLTHYFEPAVSPTSGQVTREIEK